jgi:hypothetical protein
MHNYTNHNRDIDNCFDKLEQLSSKITKLDLARKVILKKISRDAANLNNNNRNRLKLVWVNNCELIEKTETLISNRQQNFNKKRKTFKEYSKNN